MENITAMVSCFARAYHTDANACPVFSDTAARALLGSDYEAIAQNMLEGMDFFLPDFRGTPEEGLRRIVDGQLAPSVLARSAYCEAALAEETKRGCGQYVLFAAGYDSYALRREGASLAVFELDLPEVLRDKRRRMEAAGLRSSAVDVPCDLADPAWPEALLAAGYRPEEKAFGSLLGISYYLRKADFAALLRAAGALMAAGSVLCLDYPAAGEGSAARTHQALAQEAGEQMQARYTPEEMAALLPECGFAVREQLSAEDMNRRFFAAHNRLTPQQPLYAPEGVGYLLAARR